MSDNFRIGGDNRVGGDQTIGGNLTKDVVDSSHKGTESKSSMLLAAAVIAAIIALGGAAGIAINWSGLGVEVGASPAETVPTE